jgi:hypothetical protein
MSDNSYKIIWDKKPGTASVDATHLNLAVSKMSGGLKGPRSESIALSSISSVSQRMNKLKIAGSGFEIEIAGAGLRGTKTAETLRGEIEAGRRQPSVGVETNDGGGGGDVASQLAQLAAMHESGSLTAEEFADAKARLLS